MVYKIVTDFFLALAVFLILALGTAAAGLPFVVFILGDTYIKTAMVIAYLLFSAIIVRYANQYKKERGNE
jgi:membrane protein implicated in regulation of membrane protease activity